MALIEEEVVAAIAATAAAMSPRVRKVARKGIVYGLAGAFKAGDVAVAAARGFAGAAKPQSEPTPASAQPRPRAKRSSTGARQRRGAGGAAGSGGAGRRS